MFKGSGRIEWMLGTKDDVDSGNSSRIIADAMSKDQHLFVSDISPLE